MFSYEIILKNNRNYRKVRIQDYFWYIFIYYLIQHSDNFPVHCSLYIYCPNAGILNNIIKNIEIIKES